MPGLRALALAVAVAALAAPASAATVSRAPGLARLVALAPRIVVAETVEVRVDRGRGPDRDLPVTLVTLRVIETLKGAPALQLVLELPGGRSGRAALEVSGMPRFAAGDRDVLFVNDAPGTLSPILGVFAGRLRILQPEGRDGGVVLAHDGGPLPDAFAAGEAGEEWRGYLRNGIPLPVLRRAVRRRVIEAAAADLATPANTGPPALQSAGSPGALPAPGCLLVDLGPAPALANGCRDWACVVRRAVEAARPSMPAGAGAPRVQPAGGGACGAAASLAWGVAVHGRLLDPLTLAATVRTEVDGVSETRIVLNATQAWDAWDGAGGGGAGAAVDAVAVLADAIAGLAAPAAGSGTASSPSAPDADDPRAARTRQPQDPAGIWPLAADPCQGGAGAIVNPRLLFFKSPDHAKMRRYQVGYFLPRASQPVSTVDLPMSAFLERRAFDLPPGELDEMEGSLAASITSAGLATPIGHVYTYRVRGVWSRGTTAWSAPSQAFVRCAR